MLHFRTTNPHEKSEKRSTVVKLKKINIDFFGKKVNYASSNPIEKLFFPKNGSYFKSKKHKILTFFLDFDDFRSYFKCAEKIPPSFVHTKNKDYSWHLEKKCAKKRMFFSIGTRFRLLEVKISQNPGFSLS